MLLHVFVKHVLLQVAFNSIGAATHEEGLLHGGAVAGLGEVDDDGDVHLPPGEGEPISHTPGRLGEQPRDTCTDGNQRLHVVALALWAWVDMVGEGKQYSSFSG